MDRNVSRKANNGLGLTDNPPPVVINIDSPKAWVVSDLLFDRRDRSRVKRVPDFLCDESNVRVSKTMDLGHLSQGRTGLVGHVGGDHGCPLTTVFLKGVFQDIVPIVPREVDVDIGWILAVFIEKTFEEEIVSDRIDLCDSEKIGDEACCRGSPAARVGVLFCNVLHDQKVLGKSLSTNNVEFLVEPAFDLRCHLLIPTPNPVKTFLLQKEKEIPLLLHGIPRDNPLPEVPVVLDPLDDGMGIFQGFRCPGKLFLHGLWGLKPLIASGMEIRGDPAKNTIQTDHSEQSVLVMVGRMRKVDPVGRDSRNSEFPGSPVSINRPGP